jgi:hypothetical protein
VVEATEHRLEHDADLPLGERRAETEVRSAAAERNVVVGRAGDVEGEGGVEHVLVTIGRRMPEGDDVALLDGLAGHLDGSRRGAPEVRNWRAPPQDLVHRAVHQT